MGMALFLDKVQQWSDLEHWVIFWVRLWRSFSVTFDVEVLVYLLIPTHDVTSSRHPQQGIQQPVHVDFREVMNAKHVLDEHKDFNFIWSCPVFVIFPSGFLLLGGIFICLLRKCLKKTNQEQTGQNNCGCSSGRKCVGHGGYGSELMFYFDIFSLVCPVHIYFCFLGLLISLFTFSWSTRHMQIMVNSAITFITSAIVTGIVLLQLILSDSKIPPRTTISKSASGSSPFVTSSRVNPWKSSSLSSLSPASALQITILTKKKWILELCPTSVINKKKSIESAKLKAVMMELKSENGSVILQDLSKCIVGCLVIVVFEKVHLLCGRARAL